MENQRLLAKRAEYLILFYNRITGSTAETLTDIPTERLTDLTLYTYAELIRPFVADDIRAGMSGGRIQNKYGVSRGIVRRIGIRAGLYSHK